ncbi:MAG: hypothetical protein ACFFB1_01925 [Promethearchaeota archaeon]
MLEADYFFDKNTGLLLAETLDVHRWDYKEDKPQYEQYDYHSFNRKLAMVNSQIILKDYQKIEKGDIIYLFESIYWITSIGIIGSITLLYGILKRSKINIKKKENLR